MNVALFVNLSQEHQSNLRLTFNYKCDNSTLLFALRESDDRQYILKNWENDFTLQAFDKAYHGTRK